MYQTETLFPLRKLAVALNFMSQNGDNTKVGLNEFSREISALLEAPKTLRSDMLSSPFRPLTIATTLLIVTGTTQAKLTWQEMQNPNNYNEFAYQILEWTNVLDARPNYVSLTQKDIESLELIKLHLTAEAALEEKEPVRMSRGLASENVQLDGGGRSVDPRDLWSKQTVPVVKHFPPDSYNPVENYCQNGSACTSDNNFYREFERRGPYVLLPQDGDFRVIGDQVVDCTNRGGGPMAGCPVVGSTSEFCIHPNCPDRTAGIRRRSDNDGIIAGVAREGSAQTNRDLEVPHADQEENSYSQNSASESNSYARTASAPSSHAGYSRASSMAQAFQSCEANYQRALELCGSSFQSYNSQAVQNELNLRSGMMLAQYLQMARAASQSQGKSMYEICDNTEKMARSMTALNAAYTAICASAQNSCASSCSQAESYMRSTSTSDQEFTAALNLTSPGFDPARFHSTCKADMNQQLTQGLFDTAQTAQMMAQANSCKQQIAAAGPCATPEMWDSQACYDFCQEPKNAYMPACARFSAMNSNCSNPEFAQKNPMCLCINNPGDPSCGAGDLLPGDDDVAGKYPGTPGRGGSSIISSTSAGRFGSAQEFQGGAQRSGQASSASQGSFPAGAAGGPIMPGGGSKGGAQAQNGQAALRGSAYNTNIIDGVQNFGGGRAGAGGQQRRYIAYGDMNSNNPYRRIAVETDNPDFDLKQYLPPEDFEAGKVRKCYYGKDRIGCMHGPSLFDMVSRQYRKIRHQMMP
jgi:hypothetical protein